MSALLGVAVLCGASSRPATHIDLSARFEYKTCFQNVYGNRLPNVCGVNESVPLKLGCLLLIS
jgi:hypothetical protein